MTAREYLKRIRKLDMLIQARQRELDRVRAERAYITGIRYDAVRVQTSPNGNSMQTSEAIVDMERDVNLLIIALMSERHKIIGQIGLLGNAQHIAVLAGRYVEYKSFEQIACDMSYSYNHVLKLHGEALREFAKLIGFDRI